MKVVILCGGLGTRLREETEFKPKPLVEIGGKPILWHIMKIYSAAGFKDFILCLGYKGEMIKNYFLDYSTINNDFTIDFKKNNLVEVHSTDEIDWRISLVDTGLNSMTGSRVKRIEKLIKDEEFMLTYGDTIANVNVAKILQFHRDHEKIGTLLGVRPPSRFGELVLNENKVVSFMEKPNVTQTEGFINGGFVVFKTAFFDYLSPDENCILEREPLERLAKNSQLMMYPHNDFWQCMDTYRDYLYLNQIWPNAPWKDLL